MRGFGSHWSTSLLIRSYPVRSFRLRCVSTRIQRIEIGGHRAPAAVGGRLGAARAMLRDQDIRNLVNGRRDGRRSGSAGVGYCHRAGAAQVALFQRGIKRILVHDRRPRDVDQQRLPPPPLLIYPLRNEALLTERAGCRDRFVAG